MYMITIYESGDIGVTFLPCRAQMFVEDAVSAKGPIAVEVNPLSTVAELKLQVSTHTFIFRVQ